MSINIYDWGWAGKRLSDLGFESAQEIPPEKMYETIKKIFDSGLNVMIFRSGPNNENIAIAVDVKRFQQR